MLIHSLLSAQKRGYLDQGFSRMSIHPAWPERLPIPQTPTQDRVCKNNTSFHQLQIDSPSEQYRPQISELLVSQVSRPLQPHPLQLQHIEILRKLSIRKIVRNYLLRLMLVRIRNRKLRGIYKFVWRRKLRLLGI
jgi:hypothetical protein